MITWVGRVLYRSSSWCLGCRGTGKSQAVQICGCEKPLGRVGSRCRRCGRLVDDLSSEEFSALVACMLEQVVYEKRSPRLRRLRGRLYQGS
jgi:hypothetical protein